VNILPLSPGDQLGTLLAPYAEVHGAAVYIGGVAAARITRATDTFGPLTDITDNDATPEKHGFMSKLDKIKLDSINLAQITDGDMLKATYDPGNVGGDAFAMGNMQGTVATSQIGDSQVTLAKLAPITTASFLGRVSSGSGAVEVLSSGQVLTALGVAAGANNYSHPDHTGDVTSTGDGATVIASNVVSNAKLATVATGTIKGRATAGTGNVEDLSASQVRTILNVADGATAFNPAIPGPIGETTASTAKFTEISGPGGETKVKFGDYGTWGSLILKGDGTGMSGRALVEFFDSADTRIGYIYMDPSSGAMAFMNERNGRLLFGANGADHFVVFPSGGAFIGNTPTDPGNLNLTVQGTLTAGSATINGNISTGSGERTITATGWLFNGYMMFKSSGIVACPYNDQELVFGSNSRIRFLSSSTNGFVTGGACMIPISDGVEINNGTSTVYRDLKVRDLIASRSLRATPTTFASLPTAATVGDGSFANITDGATTTLGAIATGSGSLKQTVRSDGTDWRVFFTPV
jgi:hypothetical protein